MPTCFHHVEHLERRGFDGGIAVACEALLHAIGEVFADERFITDHVAKADRGYVIHRLLGHLLIARIRASQYFSTVE